MAPAAGSYHPTIIVRRLNDAYRVLHGAIGRAEAIRVSSDTAVYAMLRCGSSRVLVGRTHLSRGGAMPTLGLDDLTIRAMRLPHEDDTLFQAHTATVQRLFQDLLHQLRTAN